MPTYSYRCTACANAFDIQQSFTDDTLTECPSCQGPLRKIFSAVGVTFNGSGFYRNDSRPKQKESGSGGSSSTSSSTPSSTPASSPAPSAPKSSSPKSGAKKTPAASPAS